MVQLENQFNELRLQGMKQCWQSLVETRKHHELGLAEGLGLLLQAECQQRDNKRFQRLLKAARFRYQASIEEIKFDGTRGLDKSQIMELSTCGYVQKGEPVLITGATGCGKSFLASALGHQACAMGFKVAYFNVQKLLIRTKMSRLDGTIYKYFEQLSKTNLLILDDFGLTHLDKRITPVVYSQKKSKSYSIFVYCAEAYFFQFWGKSSCSLLALCSGIRVSTSVSHAKGSILLILHVAKNEDIIAAPWAALCEPANR